MQLLLSAPTGPAARDAGCVIGVARKDVLDVALARRAGNDERAAGNGFEVLIHDGGRAGDVAVGKRGDDGAMLAHRALGGMWPAVERQDEPAARGELAHVARQDLASGHLREHDVELGCEPNGQRIVAAARALFTVDMRFQQLDLVRREATGEPRYDQPLDPEAHDEHVTRYVPTR